MRSSSEACARFEDLGSKMRTIGYKVVGSVGTATGSGVKNLSGQIVDIIERNAK